jgi:putative Ca2+/H+ antiporter (TMEM165/GDT1 family)
LIYVFAVTTVLIALAELGDKTQLLALCLATRYRWWQVLIGIFGATLFIHLFSTLIGQAVGNLIPQLWLGIITGMLFVGFGVWTLRGEKDGDDDATPAGRFGPIVTVAIAFFLAEMGGKTQIMTVAIAADPAAVLRTFGTFGPAIARTLGGLGLSAEGLTPTQSFWGVWMGSTVGMMIADGIAIVVGSILGKRLPERLITRISGVLFVVLGVAALWTAVAKAL